MAWWVDITYYVGILWSYIHTHNIGNMFIRETYRDQLELKYKIETGFDISTWCTCYLLPNVYIINIKI